MPICVRALRSLCIDIILVHSKGGRFIKGLQFMTAAGLVPDKLSIMMVHNEKYHLQFWIPNVDKHPFTIIFKSFRSLMSGIGHLNAWEPEVLEVMNCTFSYGEIALIARAMNLLAPKVVILMNCAYDEVPYGPLTVHFHNAWSNGGKIEVVELGDEKILLEEAEVPSYCVDNSLGWSKDTVTNKAMFLDGTSSDDHGDHTWCEPNANCTKRALSAVPVFPLEP